MEPAKPPPRRDGPPFVTRPLEAGDFHKGFVSLVGQLTTMGDITEEMFAARVKEIEANPDYIIQVIEDVTAEKLIASATLLVERKFIHQCGKVGHIEDVVVHSDYRGSKLGCLIVKELMRLGKEAGCYKVILDCIESNVGFYEKCGLQRKGVQMARYYDD